MPDEELTLILKLRDEATKGLKSWRTQVTAAGAAVAAVGFKAGAEWDKATKTIVSGTGATGKALKGLQKDYQAVAKYGEGSAKAIADLNTHLGLQGKELQNVAAAALKAKVDTNLFGDVAAQLGLDAKGSAKFLDQLTVASQGTGVDIDILTRTIGKSSARWQAAGGSMDDLAAVVVKAADEFGPSGLRGAMSEVLEEVDKGLIPSVASLETQLGETTGAVERTYEASKTWRDSLRETKDAAIAYIGPAGDMLGVLGSTASGLALAGPQMLKWIKGTKLATAAQKLFNIAMRLNPIGLIITAIGLVGLAVYKWRDQIVGFIKGAWNVFVKGLKIGYNSLARFVPGLKEVSIATDDAAISAEGYAEFLEEVAETAKPLPRLMESFEEEVKELDTTLESNVATLIQWNFQLEKLVPVTQQASDEMDWLNERFDKVTEVPIGDFLEGLGVISDQTGLKIHDMTESFDVEGLEAGTIWSENFFSTISKSFEGGGGFMGGIQSLASQGFGKLFNKEGKESGGGFIGSMSGLFTGPDGAATLASTLVSTFGPLIMKGLSKLAGKVWGSLKRLFGGPDEMEKAGREAAAGARNAIASTLTDGQIAEAAGNMANAVHIAVRDATLGSGGTLEMAERTSTEMVTLLHTAEKGGVEAVAAAQKAIEEILGQNATATEDATENFASFFNEVSLEQAPAFTEAMIESFGRAQVAVESYLVRLKAIPRNITSTITTVHRDVYEGSGSSDVFRPSQRDQNRASANQPAITVQAIVSRDAVTDAMLQNAPRRQALHGTA